VGDHGGDGGVTCSGLRYRLPSPTSSVVEEDEVIMNCVFHITVQYCSPIDLGYGWGFWGHERPPTLLGCSGHHRVGGLHS
jgi:hypothetical protein